MRDVCNVVVIHGPAPVDRTIGSPPYSRAWDAYLSGALTHLSRSFQRVQAVLALKCCALGSSPLVRDSLLALYHGPLNPAPVRMAAVSLLAYSRPSLPLWQRLAISTYYEPNLAVSAYVWSTINAFAKMQDPSFRAQ